MNIAPPRSAFGASPSRGCHQWSGKVGSTVAHVLALAVAAGCTVASAQMSPVGLWRNIDDKTGQPKAEIRVNANPAGVLTGVIERPLAPVTELLCSKCTDDRKDKPKLGMEVIRGAVKAEGKESWESGRILDPDNGSTYALRMTPIEGGRKLEVRGSIGPFGRTQTWIRVQ